MYPPFWSTTFQLSDAVINEAPWQYVSLQHDHLLQLINGVKFSAVVDSPLMAPKWRNPCDLNPSYRGHNVRLNADDISRRKYAIVPCNVRWRTVLFRVQSWRPLASYAFITIKLTSCHRRSGWGIIKWRAVFVCRSVCRMPRHNSRMERPKKPKITRIEAHHTDNPNLFRDQKIKGQSYRAEFLQMPGEFSARCRKHRI